jgi:hypothetical protein
MTTVAKIVTLLIGGSLLVLIIKNPGGFSTDAGVVTGGLDQTLEIESGSNPSLTVK